MGVLRGIKEGNGGGSCGSHGGTMRVLRGNMGRIWGSWVWMWGVPGETGRGECDLRVMGGDMGVLGVS